MQFFYATIEHIRHGEAILTMTDQAGEWAGASLIQCRSGRREDLYEAGYTAASVNVRAKGGRLETYREIES